MLLDWIFERGFEFPMAGVSIKAKFFYENFAHCTCISVFNTVPTKFGSS